MTRDDQLTELCSSCCLPPPACRLLYTPAIKGTMAAQEVMRLPAYMPHHSARDMTASWNKIAARLDKAVKVLLQ